MKYAIVGHDRREAEPGLDGKCPLCGATAIPKCGELKVWHWAHKSKRKCDHWWENETEWHRGWKNHFPVEWQESVHASVSGEKHIADVKTNQDWVIEFQHSNISTEERQSRNDFYGQVVWIVDGLRRKRDLKQFNIGLRDGTVRSHAPRIVEISPYDSRLIREWQTCDQPVFFDFGPDVEDHDLWLLIPVSSASTAFAALVSKTDFVRWLKDGDFDPWPLINIIKDEVVIRERRIREQREINALRMTQNYQRFSTGKWRPRRR